ncbi:LPXTG cell wall anchor domain-containing protein [Lactobacillus helveticus]|nr:LPXTG cell wall anchor domain-containing protein [Lactobacillus helveticus]
MPQTGEESLSWLGILLSNLGLGSMFIKRKKK